MLRRALRPLAQRGTWFRHAALLLIVLIWLVPLVGLGVSSFRDNQQVSTTGWWSAWDTRTRADWARTASADSQRVLPEGGYRIEGRLFPQGSPIDIRTYALRMSKPAGFAVGQTVEVPDGFASESADGSPDGTLLVEADGRYVLKLQQPMREGPGLRVFIHAAFGPTFTLDNYRYALGTEGVGEAFWNTFRLALPATFLPLVLAFAAAYALAFMPRAPVRWVFPLLLASMVVPVEMLLIPLLRLYNQVGASWGMEARSLLGACLLHSALSLPIGTFLLTNYLRRLPSELIDAAFMDCRSHMQVIRHVVLPLALPGIAAFAVFQFLWVWNDYLVSLVFLGTQPDQVVLSVKLRNMLGCTGYNWEFLPAAAFVSMVVPLGVFLLLQRALARGLLLATAPREV